MSIIAAGSCINPLSLCVKMHPRQLDQGTVTPVTVTIPAQGW
jgi:hypothetical protein